MDKIYDRREVLEGTPQDGVFFHFFPIVILVFLGEVILGFARQDLQNYGETWPFNSVISTEQCC